MRELTENMVFWAGGIKRSPAAARAFFPCAPSRLPVKALLAAATCSTFGKLVGQYSVIPNFALSRNMQRQGDRLCSVSKTTGRGARSRDPNIHDNLRQDSNKPWKSSAEFAREFCEEELRSNKSQPNLNERTRIAPTQ